MIIVIKIINPIIGVAGLCVYFGDLPGIGVDLIFIFDAVHDKFDFVVPVVQVVILFDKLDVVPAHLGRHDFLGCLPVDIALIAEGIVIVVFAQRHRLGTERFRADGVPDGLGNFVQKGVGRVGGTPSHFEDDVAFMAVDRRVKIPAVVHPGDQFPGDGLAGLPHITGVAGEDGVAVVVEAVQAQDVPAVVILHFDFRVDA